MKQRFAWALGLFLAIGLGLAVSPAHAVITRLTPLKEVLGGQQFILVAKVEKLDPDRPAMVLSVVEDLKGQAPFRRLPVNLTGDTEAKKHDHSAQLLKRLAPDLQVLVFANKRGKRYEAFVFTDGTWFQLLGQADDDVAKPTFALTHGEPYLRRTFNGTTAELKKIIDDGIKKGVAPPEPDPKAEPGFGPEIKLKGSLAPSIHDVEVAVIPTVFLMGPLALLAALFPAVFGGLAIFMKRWLVLLSVSCTNSTLLLVHLLFRGYARDSWWGSDAALWAAMTLVTLAGVFWSAWRYRTVLQGGPEENLPRKGERIVLWVLSGLGLVLVAWQFGQLLDSPWKEMLPLWIGAWAGSLYILYLRIVKVGESSPVLPTEQIVLWGMVFACANLGILEAAGTRSSAAPPVPSESTSAGSARLEKVVWSWPEKPITGSVYSSPLVAGNRVYFGAIHAAGFSTYGVVYCIERDTGKEVWKFDAGEELQQVFSSPCLAEGRLYFGEGLHENRICKFYCVDAKTGKELWSFKTLSHTESSPCVLDGRVYFGAGDEGVYCLDAASGKELWHFQDQAHVDGNPVAVGQHVFVGSGASRTYNNTKMYCLDALKGTPIWQVRTELPVWGEPVVRGDRAYFALGNGRFTMSDAEKPSGAVICVEANTGKQLWRHDLPDAVLVKPAVDDDHVYVGCRDKNVYALELKEGKTAWQRELGSPVVASLALAPVLNEWESEASLSGPRATRSVFALGSHGQVVCLDPAKGDVQWSYDLAKETGTAPDLFSSPAVIVQRDGEGERRRIFFGAALNNPVAGAAAKVFCLEDRFELK